MEYKHADFHRAIKGFRRYKDVWAKISVSESGLRTEGHAAYARRESVKFAKLAVDTHNRFMKAGVGIEMLRDIPAERTLAEQVELHRGLEQRLFPVVKA